MKTISDCASITVGQIMTRVSAGNDDASTEINVLIPKAISNGRILREELGTAEIKGEMPKDKLTCEGDIVIKLSTPYDAAYVSEEDAGYAIPSFCAAIRFKDKSYGEAEKNYLSAVLNSDYIRNQLSSKVAGTVRPMIRPRDIMNLEMPDIPKEDMKRIGEAYVLSAKKRAMLLEMERIEKEIMDNIVINSIVGDQS